MSDCLKREGAKFIGDTDYVVPSVQCLSCDKILDRASGVNEDDAPEPGNITICIGCGHLMAYADGLSLRELTDAEALAIAGDKRILDLQSARVRFFRERAQR